MEQYKVILVDDEVEVIDVMKKKIRWNDLGFDVVGSATNGVKALELVEKLQPDVVLTDIKMPYMDGLELARKLNQDYPNIYIMLCTGFDEFEYAKEAVHLEIKEYMLKPISATELSESLMKLKATLDREREEKLNVKKLEDYFQEVLPKLQSNFFISLIEGRVREEDYERFLLDYQVDMKGPLFCCIIFHTSENDVPDGMNPLLLSMSVEREIKQRLMENCNCQEFIYMGNTILIMELHSEDEIAQLTDKCDRFCRWAWRIMGAAVPLEETKMQELFRAIHVGDQEKIRKEAIKETEKLHKNAATISQYNLATMEIVSGFFKFCANNSMDFNEISGNVQNLYERVTQLDESSMTNWIINMSMAISEKLRSTRNSTSRRIITDAQNIVKDRYMEPALSLDDVCADLGVSNSYFSSIFKKETGQSFVSYLTDYRMDRAEEMVLNTDEKSYKIAEKVGYQDANYFSYVFKKKFGVSPSKYRASGK